MCRFLGALVILPKWNCGGSPSIRNGRFIPECSCRSLFPLSKRIMIRGAKGRKYKYKRKISLAFLFLNGFLFLEHAYGARIESNK
mmetsp:Transcript_192/g.336  ORF Transcript_192/g.336 Transcript_192/m.336 type:complete len:85 (+) Transcript_192:1066-1320(+)